MAYLEGGVAVFFVLGLLTGLAAAMGRSVFSKINDRFGGKNSFIIVFWASGLLMWWFTTDIANFLGTSRADITLIVIMLFIFPTLVLLFQERNKLRTSYVTSKRYGSKAKSGAKTLSSKVQRN